MKKLKILIIFLFSLGTINCYSGVRDTINCYSSFGVFDTLLINLQVGDTLAFNYSPPTQYYIDLQLYNSTTWTFIGVSPSYYVLVGNEWGWLLTDNNTFQKYIILSPYAISNNWGYYNYVHTNISEYSMVNISIFPNPAMEVLKINSPQKVKAFVYDCLGDMIMEKQLPQGNSEIGTSTLAKGIYIVKLIDDRNNITNKKIVIE